MTPVRTDNVRIPPVNNVVEIDVTAEVPPLAVWPIGCAIAIHVSGKEAERNIIYPATAIHTGDSQWSHSVDQPLP